MLAGCIFMKRLNVWEINAQSYHLILFFNVNYL